MTKFTIILEDPNPPTPPQPDQQTGVAGWFFGGMATSALLAVVLFVVWTTANSNTAPTPPAVRYPTGRPALPLPERSEDVAPIPPAEDARTPIKGN